MTSAEGLKAGAVTTTDVDGVSVVLDLVVEYEYGGRPARMAWPARSPGSNDGAAPLSAIVGPRQLPQCVPSGDWPATSMIVSQNSPEEINDYRARAEHQRARLPGRARVAPEVSRCVQDIRQASREGRWTASAAQRCQDRGEPASIGAGTAVDHHHTYLK
jgi:hypothetical protein